MDFPSYRALFAAGLGILAAHFVVSGLLGFVPVIAMPADDVPAFVIWQALASVVCGIALLVMAPRLARGWPAVSA